MADSIALAAHTVHWALIVGGGVVLVLLLRPALTGARAGAGSAAVGDLRRRVERGELLAVATARAQRELQGPLTRDLVLPAAALTSLAAAWTHAFVIGAHASTSLALGVLFAAAAAGQTCWAGLVLTRPSRWLLVAGALGNALVLALWAASRTIGLPLVGVEPVGTVDLMASAYEVAVVVACVVAARGALAPPPLAAGRRRGVVALAAAVTALLVVAGI